MPTSVYFCIAALLFIRLEHMIIKHTKASRVCAKGIPTVSAFELHLARRVRSSHWLCAVQFAISIGFTMASCYLSRCCRDRIWT